MKANQGRTNPVLIGSLLACLLLVCERPAAASQEYEWYIAEGNESFENGEYEKALTAFETANELAGGHAEEPLLGMVRAMRALERDSEAMEIPGEESVDDLPRIDDVRIALCNLRRSFKAASEQEAMPSQEEPQEGHEESAGIIYVGQGVQPPERILDPQPQYSVEARRSRIQGVVIVRATIDKYGCVTEVLVLKGLDRELDKNTVSTLSRWVFKPAMLDGKPVDVYYNLTVNFRLSRKQS